MITRTTSTFVDKVCSRKSRDNLATNTNGLHSEFFLFTATPNANYFYQPNL